MSSSTIDFISKTKLAELERQRSRLLKAYGALLAKAQNESGVAKLKRLSEVT